MSPASSRLLLVLAVAVAGCWQATSLAAADAEAVHYWNGQSRVVATLALDELQVETMAAAAGAVVEHAVKGLVARTPVPASALGRTRSQLRFAATDRAGLQAQARALAQLPGVVAVEAVLYAGKTRAVAARATLGDRLALRVQPGQDLAALAQRRGLRVVERVPYSPDTWILETTDGAVAGALAAADALYEQDGAVFATPLVTRRHTPRGTPADPLFASQWHLQNNGSGQVPGGVAGNDIHVVPWWDFAGGQHLGAGINVAMVDDGLETTHEDLSANVRNDLGINFNGAPGGANDPSPGVDDFHGTWTAGLVAARDDNGLGVCGVAPRASLVGVRLIAGATSDSTDGQAMTHHASDTTVANRVSISSNSWGPSDDGFTLEGPGPLTLAALQNGTSVGRGGKGIVYVWAGGNGLDNGDNVAYDGFASSRYVIAVGAIDSAGKQTYYSESGCALLVDAPGGEVNGVVDGIVTTDRTGKTGSTSFPGEDFAGNYTTIAEGLQGTSFACPVVSGVAALLLEANPALTWRDVQHLLVRTAAKNDSGDSGWVDNGASRHFNHKYGFGRVDAAAAAALAAPATWVLAPAEATPLTASESVAVAIPDNDSTGITRTRTISGAPAGFRIEHVELTVNVSHRSRGDLHFRLTSPLGMVSDIPSRPNDNTANPDADSTDYSNWTFTSVAHWGESPAGVWSLRIADERPTDSGTLNSWSLTIHGYVPHPAPTLGGVSPATLAESSSPATITLTGSGFVAGVSQAQWNGVALATTVTSATQLTAVVPASDLAAPGTATVTVVNGDFDGGAALVSGGQTVTVSGPIVTAVGSSLASGAYSAIGFVVPVSVTFSSPVTVTGTPTLTLNTTPSRTATYASGSGSATLVFSYSIADGDRSDHLDQASTSALSAAGGTIRDAGANNAVLTLPAPGAAGSLAAARTIVIGGGLPVVTALNSTAANGVYGVGATIPIQVQFSSAVVVTGTPQLTLATGASNAVVDYTSGSGSSVLLFTYTVAAGQSSADLDAASTQALALHGGTINAQSDARAAVLTLPVPGQSGSLGAFKNLVIDTTPAPESSRKKKCGGGLFALILLLGAWAMRGVRLVPAARTPRHGTKVSRSSSPVGAPPRQP